MSITLVAPYVGAWIETEITSYVADRHMSHPTWVRGLKQHRYGRRHRQQQVAPYVGAWIETYMNSVSTDGTGSHPTWVRGLKLILLAHILKN